MVHTHNRPIASQASRGGKQHAAEVPAAQAHQGVPSRPRSVRGSASGSKNTASPKSAHMSSSALVAAAAQVTKLTGHGQPGCGRASVCPVKPCSHMAGVRMRAVPRCDMASRAMRLPLTDGLQRRFWRVGQQHEVAGLDVAVQDALAVALGYRAQHRPHVAGHLRAAAQG